MAERVLPPPVGTVRLKMPGERVAAFRHASTISARERLTGVVFSMVLRLSIFWSMDKSNRSLRVAMEENRLRRSAFFGSQNASVSSRSASTSAENMNRIQNSDARRRLPYEGRL